MDPPSLAADARKWADGKSLARLKLVAGILGIRLDDLRQRARLRDEQRKPRIHRKLPIQLVQPRFFLLPAIILFAELAFRAHRAVKGRFEGDDFDVRQQPGLFFCHLLPACCEGNDRRLPAEFPQVEDEAERAHGPHATAGQEIGSDKKRALQQNRGRAFDGGRAQASGVAGGEAAQRLRTTQATLGEILGGGAGARGGGLSGYVSIDSPTTARTGNLTGRA